MPGFVTIMSGNNGSNGPINAASFAEQKPLLKMQAGAGVGGPVNGADMLSNGQDQKPAAMESSHAKLPSGEFIAQASSVPLDLPPEIHHETDGYVSLGKLTERVAQQSWLDLSELVDQISSMPSPENRPFLNGFSKVSPATSSDNNVERKLLWLNWANTTREKLIKLIVLARWSRNADQIKTMVDLMFWANERDNAMVMLTDGLGSFKRDLHEFKARNPDIKTALEILSTGKAAWIPDMNMLPLKKLAPEKMLSVLRDMDALLSFRLNLHEELPPHLRDWTVANGRATFSFSNEFEFDLTLGGDDMTKQLYFVDLRFLYSPAPRLTDGLALKALRLKADELLSTSGIAGCAEFLRNFVQTQQISTMRSQALELRRGTWASSLRVDNMRRWLTTEYWAETSFPKSWIEVGIISGPSGKKPLPGHSVLPLLHLKWKRYGTEADIPHNIDLLVPDISVERVLKRIIAAHSNAILQAAYDKLLEAADVSCVSLSLAKSDVDAVDCHLDIRFGRFLPKVTFAIEAHSGQLSLHPVTESASRAERDLNSCKNPMTDVFPRLEAHICDEFLRSVEIEATRCGFSVSRKFWLAQKHAVEKFGSKCSFIFFVPPTWRDCSWRLALTVNLRGEKWWAVEVQTPQNSNEASTLSHVLPLPHFSYASCRQRVDAALLRQIHRNADDEMDSFINADQLDSLSVPYRIERTPHANITGTASGNLRLLFTQSSALLPAVKQRIIADTVCVQHRGIDPINGTRRSVVKGGLLIPAPVMDVLTGFQSEILKFQKPSTFSIFIEIPFTTGIVEPLKKGLIQVARLVTLVAKLKQQDMAPSSLSLDAISFKYHIPEPSSKDPELSCTINLPGDESSPIKILLLPADSNPHARTQLFLENMIQANDMPSFLKTLKETLPVVRGLAVMDSHGAASVRTRGVDSFRIAYQDALTTFDLALRRRRRDAYWVLSELPPPGASLKPQKRLELLARRPPGYQEAVGAFFAEEAGGVRGFQGALMCPAGSGVVEGRIVGLDMAVRGVLANGPAAAATAAGGAAAATAANAVPKGLPAAQARSWIT